MKTNTISYDYGECEICDAPMNEKVINQDFWIRGQLIVVEDVPTGVCTRCGEKVVRAEVGRRIAKLITDSDRLKKARKLSVPAVKFDLAELVG
ncbi:MAG: YgiT-type zinc finger protein [bacterium]|nr:YgiT-type zinc finger protein [bacterium]